MRWMIVRSCAVSFIVLTVAHQSGAQLLYKDAASQKLSISPQQHARIVSLLSQVLEQARSVDDLAFAVHAQMQAASLLWQHDREQARAIYRQAFDSLAPASTSKADAQSMLLDAPPRRSLSYVEKQQLRGEILNEIANRDSDLADEMARAIADSIGKDVDCFKGSAIDCQNQSISRLLVPSTSQTAADVDRRELLVSVALRIVERAPQQAMAMGQLSMVAGLSPNFTRLLVLMRGTDPALADLLFSSAVARLEQLPIVELADLHTLSSYLITVVNTHSKRQTVKSIITRYLRLSLNQLARCKERALAGVKRDESDTLYFLGRHLTELFSRFMPGRLDDLKRCILELGETSISLSVTEATEAPLVSTQESTDSKASDEQSDRLNARAAIESLSKGETAEAFRIAQKINAVEMRDRVFAQVARRYISQSSIEDAIAAARFIINTESRVDVVAAVACAAVRSGNRQRAAELLNEEEGVLSKGRPTPEIAQSLLKVASTFALFDPSRSFEVMHSAIRAMNEALRQRQNKQDLAAAGTEARNQPGQDTLPDSSLETALSALARIDFDRALILAQELADKEASVLAQLAVCRGALSVKVQAEQETGGVEFETSINHF